MLLRFKIIIISVFFSRRLLSRDVPTDLSSYVKNSNGKATFVANMNDVQVLVDRQNGVSQTYTSKAGFLIHLCAAFKLKLSPSQYSIRSMYRFHCVLSHII